jgi:GcrA cell cycle regulator
MRWTEDQENACKAMWTEGKSAAQIAAVIQCSRSAVCAKLQRLNLKRGRKQPTAKPRIRSERRRIVRPISQKGATERRSNASQGVFRNPV